MSFSKQKPTALNFLKKLKHYIQEKLKAGNLLVVFNRYEDFGRKLLEWKAFQVRLTSPMSSHKATLTSYKATLTITQKKLKCN